MSGLLGTIYSQGDRAKRYVKGLLSDPKGTIERTAGLLGDNLNAQRGLLNEAIGDDLKIKDKGKFGQLVDSTLGGVMGFAPVGMTVWHGSPHQFSRFDAGKIGTGEGAQAYGHGLYFAESPEVAKSYQQALAGPGGSIYKVDLPDPAIARMLDWDKPLSQQPEAVQKAAKKFGITDAKNGDDLLWKIKRLQYGVRESHPSYPGGEAARFASERLRQEGIPGVRYLDEGSRGTANGTSNFVVFPGEEGILSILERNGQPLR